LNPKKQNSNLHDTIHNLIKQDFEGKCIEEGYIKPGSSHITKRSLLKIVPNTFGANMYVDVRIKVEICHPVKGNIIECTIEKINKMGLMAVAGPLSIVIPRNFHSNKDAFKDIDIKSVIQIEIIGARYEINWDHIDVIAKLYDNHKKKKTVGIHNADDELKIIETDEPVVDVLENLSDTEGTIEEVEDIEEDYNGEDDEIIDEVDDAADDEDVEGAGGEGVGGAEAEVILDEENIDDEGNMVGGTAIVTKDLLDDSESESDDNISELTDENNDEGSDVGDDGDYGDDEGI